MSVGDMRDTGATHFQTLEPQPRPRRKLSSRFGLLHLVALASGLLAFLLILSWMRAQQDLVEVAVAAEEIPSGNVIDPARFDFIEIPADATFGNRTVSREEAAAIAGSVATRRIAAGEPILDSDLRRVDTPEGLRAMSLPVDIGQAVGGVLAVGDRVDIIGFDDSGPRYVATDVAVVDVPGERSSAFGAGARFAITVAVDDVQALALAEALAFADLHVLRSTGAPQVTLERMSVPDEPARADTEEGGD